MLPVWEDIMNLANLILKSIEGATSRTKSIFGGTNAMSATDVIEFINEYPVVLVSTVDIHGAPHVTGKAAVLVDSRTYFGAPEDTAMGRNLRRNPNVALAFAEPPWKRHVFMYGKVRFLEGGSDEEGLVRDAHKATHGYETSGLVEALPEKIFTWKGSP